jgi:hypothetical protein
MDLLGVVEDYLDLALLYDTAGRRILPARRRRNGREYNFEGLAVRSRVFGGLSFWQGWVDTAEERFELPSLQCSNGTR